MITRPGCLQHSVLIRLALEMEVGVNREVWKGVQSEVGKRVTSEVGEDFTSEVDEVDGLGGLFVEIVEDCKVSGLNIKFIQLSGCTMCFRMPFLCLMSSFQQHLSSRQT